MTTTATRSAPDAPATRRARREAARRRVWGPVASGVRWVSPLGWAILALGVLCWYVGVRFGWVELLVVAAACGVLVVACLALTIGRVHVDIHSEVDPRRVTVGDPATGRIVVRNLARTPLLPLLVELPVGVTAARFVMPPMRAGAEHEELFVVPTHRRGVIAVGPARTVRGDPLGVLRRTVEFSQVQELFVHPRTVASGFARRRPAARPRGHGHRGPLDERPGLPRPARVPAGRRPPLHPLAVLGQGRTPAGPAVPRHPALPRHRAGRHRPALLHRRRGHPRRVDRRAHRAPRRRPQRPRDRVQRRSFPRRIW